MTEYITTFYFVLIALILLVILVFLYKLTLAMGRLDRRLEQLVRHLRDLNLYDFHHEEGEVLGEATEVERRSGADEGDLGEADSTDSAITPSRYEEDGAKPRGPGPSSGTDTTPLRFKPREDGQSPSEE